MNEVNYILTTMTEQSLIIVDELGRSTSVEQGTAIAMAICERFATTKAYIYLTTHYTLITKLADLFVNIKVWQMETKSQGHPNDIKSMRLDFQFKLIPGVTNLKYYGLYMVKNIWPVRILKHVNDLQKQINKMPLNVRINVLHQGIRLKHELECKLSKLKLQKRLTLSNLNQYLGEYYNEIEKLQSHSQPSCSDSISENFNNIDSLMSENAVLNHSIFDMTQYNTQPVINLEQSQYFLDNFENMDKIEDNQCFTIDMNESNIESDRKIDMFSTTKFSQEPTNNLPLEHKLHETYAPNSQINNSTTSSSRHPLIPEINMSYSASECDVTLISDNHSQIYYSQLRNDISLNTYQSLYDPEIPIENPFPLENSNLQQHQEKQPLFQIQNTNQLIEEEESPFTSEFVAPLQTLDIQRTSTPVIINPNENQNPTSLKISKNKPDITFTIVGNISATDIPSIEEDLRSFMTEIENDDLKSFNEQEMLKESQESVELWESCNETLPEENVQKTTATQAMADLHRPQMQEGLEANQPSEIKSAKQEVKKEVGNMKQSKHKHLHLFPKVRINNGPNDASFVANNGSGTFGEIIKPILIRGATSNLDNSIPNELVISQETKNKLNASTINSGHGSLQKTDATNLTADYFTEDDHNISEENVNLNQHRCDVTANSSLTSISYSPLCHHNASPTEINEKFDNNETKQSRGKEIEILNSHRFKNVCESTTNLSKHSSIVQNEEMSSTASHALTQINKEQQNSSEETINFEINNNSNRAVTETTKKTTSSNEDKNSDYTIIYPGGISASYTIQPEQTTTVSEASRKRNVSSSSLADTIANVSSNDSVKSSATKRSANLNRAISPATLSSIEQCKVKKRKFVAPLKKMSQSLFSCEPSIEKTKSEQVIEMKESKGTQAKNVSKFVPPWKLTEKQIKLEFLEQDKKMFDLTSGNSSDDMIKMWEQRLKRPTPRQIKQQTVFAVLKKTHKGFEVVPSPIDENSKRRRKNSPKKFFSSHSSINLNIFSDQNAETFEKFIKSKEKDYKFFDFKFGNKEDESGNRNIAVNDDNIFNFKRVDKNDSFTNGNISMTFVRKSKSSTLPNSENNQNLSFLSQIAGNSLTPDGFYKRNKKDMDYLIEKYKN